MTITWKVISKIWRFLKSKHKNLISYGGAGSGKSYTTAQFLITKAYNERNKHFLITRKTNPSLKITAYQLILQLLNEIGIGYEEKKVEQIILLPNGSKFFFRGMDDPEKIKSSEFNYIWLEEATEFTEKDYQQLRLRLRKPTGDRNRNQMFLTFNPISKTNWVYPYFFEYSQPDTSILHTTYKDNPFLDREYVQILENLIEQDKTYYEVYTLGKFATIENTIYSNYDIVSKLPKHFDEIIYGVDYGYNNPSAVIKIGLRDQEVWIIDELYKSKLTNADLIEELKEFVNPKGPLYCDSAEPNRIEEMIRAGFNAFPADKSVKDGIDFVKRKKIHIHEYCVNTIKEIRNYKWKEDRGGNVLDEPVKFMDHCYDDKTEILTENGWKLFKDLELTEKVATLNQEGIIEFHIPDKYIKEYYEGTMHFYESNNVNFSVSPNHRMYVANQYSVKIKKSPIFDFKRIADLPELSWIARVGKINGGKRIDLDLAEFVGFWLAEGCKSFTRGRKYVHVDNSDKEYLEHFKNIFGGSLYKSATVWRLSIRSDKLYDFLPNGKCFEKRIPKIFFEASEEVIDALIKGYIKGDGRINNKGTSADSTSKGLIDDLQALSFMVGMASNVYRVSGWRFARTPSNETSLCRPVWRISWSKEKRGVNGLGLTEMHKSKIKNEHYKGYIYCVEVKNHVIAVRRNGRIMWSGNSMDAIRYALYSHKKGMPVFLTRTD